MSPRPDTTTGPTGTPAAATPDVDDIMVVGVGGQGVIMAAAIIADAALLSGLDVKLIETRGMSQRGGSVNSHIRIGERVTAPAISPGEVDHLLAFEAAEGLRLAPSLAPDGVAIVNTQQIVPPLASSAEHSYPYDAVERLGRLGRDVVVVDGNAIAGEIGDQKVAGVVLVGALAARLPFGEDAWRRAIERNVPPAWLELNLAAFAAGLKAGAQTGATEAGGGHTVASRDGGRP
jgi:indolepyruvate ferredoxin oxidoreductase beta subunit